MKKTRRFAAIAAAAMMTAALAVPMTGMNAFAASGDNSITIKADGKNMTHGNMSAYQVFAGTYNATDKNLTVTGWGDGINVVEFIRAIKDDTTLNGEFNEIVEENSVATATAVANIVGGWTTGGVRARAFAKLAVANKSTTTSGVFNAAGADTDATISGLADGYYVIMDAAAATANPSTDGSAFTLGLLQVAGGTDTTVKPKLDYPTVVKKVKEDDSNESTDYGAGYNDVADWDVNTAVPFKIIASMPSNIDVYDHYYMEFTDTLDDNFGAPENIVVRIDDTALDATKYELTTGGAKGNDMSIVIKDLKDCSADITKDTKVTVTYTAKLNVQAEGVEAAVIGRPGQENKVDLTYSNNPNNTGNGSSKPDDTGKTPEDKVIVFTYELDVTKIDGVTDEKLQGAEFKLHRGGSASESAKEWAVVDTNGYFTKWTTNETEATTLKSDTNGVFKIIGLDDGTYYLTETKAPTNYNKPSEAFTVVIDASTLFTQEDYDKNATEGDKIPLIGLSATIGGENATVNDKMGIVSGTIENNRGSKLPGTGGIGTVLFYVVGGVLVVGAGVTLITKKRVGKDSE